LENFEEGNAVRHIYILKFAFRNTSPNDLFKR
jgi:hypothetical protein